MAINCQRIIKKGRNQIQGGAENGVAICQHIRGGRHIGVQEMTRGYVNGDVKIINISDYSGMVCVSVLIQLVGIFNIMTRGIRKIWEERRGIYGEGNHFQEGLIGGGLIMGAVEIAYLLDRKPIQRYWLIINMEGQILNPKTELMELENNGRNVQKKGGRAIQNLREVWLDMDRKTGGYIGRREIHGAENCLVIRQLSGETQTLVQKKLV